MRKKLRTNGSTSKAGMWDALPWKPVNLENENLGEFEDSVFFGLEEIDGNAYKLKKDSANGLRPEPVLETEVEVVTVDNTLKGKKRKTSKEAGTVVADDVMDEVAELPAKKKGKKSKNVEVVDILEEENKSEKKRKSKKSKAVMLERTMEVDEEDVPAGPLASLKALYVNAPPPVLKEDVAYLKEQADWAPGLKISSILSQALEKLGFVTPTPIQSSAIPLTTADGCDIVGAAETGSGKTLVRKDCLCALLFYTLFHNFVAEIFYLPCIWCA